LLRRVRNDGKDVFCRYFIPPGQRNRYTFFISHYQTERY
jgi:hypothetical protein